MIKNLNLTVLIRAGQQADLLRVPLHQSLQEQMAEDWGKQYDEFMNETEEINFDAGYNPEEHERFCLTNYELPEVLKNEKTSTIHALAPIANNEDRIESIRALVGFARENNRRGIVLFQNFSKSRVIRPGRSLLLQANVYNSIQRPGFTLDTKIAAVYKPSEKKLLFRNFRIANTFLPLSDFYAEASEQEIRTLLNHNKLAPEDISSLATKANQWFRKRFALLQDSQVLERYSVQEIIEHAIEYEVEINIDNSTGDDRIVIPADKSAAKKLLQFLNEEIFLGAITNTLYETNSKRQAE